VSRVFGFLVQCAGSGSQGRPFSARVVASAVRDAGGGGLVVAWQPPEIFDTLRIARRLLPGRASYRLGALTSAFHLADGLPDGLSPHRAVYDALGAARLFVKLATRAATLEELHGSPPGKHELVGRPDHLAHGHRARSRHGLGRDRGRPKGGSMVFSKRVMALIRSPVRVRT
jgi:DNA polymerase III epsilon subunit-like protein